MWTVSRWMITFELRILMRLSSTSFARGFGGHHLNHVSKILTMKRYVGYIGRRNKRHCVGNKLIKSFGP